MLGGAIYALATSREALRHFPIQVTILIVLVGIGVAAISRIGALSDEPLLTKDLLVLVLIPSLLVVGRSVFMLDVMAYRAPVGAIMETVPQSWIAAITLLLFGYPIIRLIGISRGAARQTSTLHNVFLAYQIAIYFTMVIW